VNRTGQGVLLILAALAVALATLLETPDAKHAAPRLDVVAQSGDVVIDNSKEGLPIVSIENGAPGNRASGFVTMENTGTSRGYFYLAPQDLVSNPGPGGGVLAENLNLHVTLTKGGVTRKKYLGPLSNMGVKEAGRFFPGEVGTYEFKVTYRDTGIPGPPTPSRPVRGDNKYQGTSASVTFGWSTSPG
jgi:hypothetical protein